MEQNMKYKKNEQGITLVALVVTIIILLILAGISIAMLTGDNGIISKSGEAKNAAEKSQEKEELELAVIRFTDKRGNLDATKIVNGLNNDVKNLNSVTATDGKFPVKVEYKNGHKYGISKDGDIIENIIVAGETAPDDSNATYISGSNIVVIPAGYTVSNVKVVNQTTGEVEKDETTIENGLVITKDGNEWVWIPVSSSDLSLMYTHKTAGWTLSGTIGDNAIVTNYKSNGRIDVVSNLTRENPGDTSSYKEPDVLDNATYDNNSTNWTTAGFNGYIDMAIKLREDYKNMIDSTKKYGGFYVGRYELSNAGTQKNQEPLTSVNWYNLYAACKSIDNIGVETRMIWGCQWDQVCKFISTAKDANGTQISLTDSRKYGNYTDSQAPANNGNYSSNNKRNTGSNEAWKTNNIYDLAGNCWAWTQEAYGTSGRAIRGGGYSLTGWSRPVSCRFDINPTVYSFSNISSRPVLYFK